MKIRTSDGRLITREEFFRESEKFHENRAKLPFEEKIKILVELQKIAASIRPEKKKLVWRL
jgi:hypothetical protein